MNYQSLKKNKLSKGKVAIIIISIIMVVALALTGGFAIYRYFQRDRAKYIFEDTKLLDVKNINELEGVRFASEDLSYTGFKEDLPETIVDSDSMYLSIINLHKNDYGNKFKEPEIGDVYKFEIQANGKTYESENMEIVDYHSKGTVEGVVVFDAYKTSEIEIYLLPYCYTQEVSPIYEVVWSPDVIGTVVTDNRPKGSVVGGYCFVIVTFEALEELKFISIEKVD